jgi:hypothetical protein
VRGHVTSSLPDSLEAPLLARARAMAPPDVRDMGDLCAAFVQARTLAAKPASLAR